MAEDDLSFESLTFGDDKSQDDDDDLKDKKISEFKESEEPEKNVLFISAASYSDKINSISVIKFAETFGELKNHNFRDKQSFGFVQFADDQAYERAVEKMNDMDVEGTRVFVEKCIRITPGRDPRTHEANSEFKNSTLVLKNLPFQLKQEKLEELLNQLTVKPLNVSYLYDGTGMFRGMAFVKYKEIEHAASVFESLNNLDITGRKVRVEYKRVTKESENTQDADEKKIQDQLNSFRANAQINELAFPAGSSYQKKQIRHIAEKLGLGHYTSGEFIVIKKSDSASASSSYGSYHGSSYGHPQYIPKDQKNSQGDSHGKSDSWKDSGSFGGRGSSGVGSLKGGQGNSMGLGQGQQGQGQDIKGRRRGQSDASKSNQHSYENGHLDKYHLSPRERSESQGITINRSHGSHGGSFSAQSPSNFSMSPLGHLKSPPNTISMGSSPTYRNSAARMVRADEGVIQPVRQPRGPDGTTGFSDDYRQQRGKRPTVDIVISEPVASAAEPVGV